MRATGAVRLRTETPTKTSTPQPAVAIYNTTSTPSAIYALRAGIASRYKTGLRLDTYSLRARGVTRGDRACTG